MKGMLDRQNDIVAESDNEAHTPGAVYFGRCISATDKLLPAFARNPAGA